MNQDKTDLTVQLNAALADLPQTADIVCELATQMATTTDPGAALALLTLAVSPVDNGSPLSEKSPASWISQFFPTHMRRVVVSTTTALPPVPWVVKETALKSLMSLVASIRPQELPTWDYRMRDMSGSYWYETALDRAVRAIPAAELREGLAAVLCVVSSSRDGYIREAAVRELAANSDGTAILFLLWRSIDWVEQVRQPAIAAIRERLVEGNCGAFARALPLIPRIEGVTGVDSSDLISDIYAMLLREPGQTSLVGALGSTDQKLRRQVCAVLDRMATPPNLSVITTVMRDSDPMVRRWLLRWEGKLRASDPPAAWNLRASLLKDRAAGIRAEAVRSIAVADGAEAMPLLRTCLTDPSSSVRQAVRYRLANMTLEDDLAAVYRVALIAARESRSLALAVRRRVETNRLIGTIGGLGETGTADDFECVAEFLNDRSRVAVAVLRAMKLLSEERARPFFLQAVIDARPGMRHAARGFLEQRLSEGDADAITKLWKTIADDVPREALVDITLRLPPWPALRVLLAAANQPGVCESAVGAMKGWRPAQIANYAPTPPDAAVRAALEAAFEESSSVVPVKLWQWLKKTLTS